MKFLFAISFIFLSTVVNAEEPIVFNLQYCLDNSTHIFRAKVISTSGLLQINETIKGKDQPATLEIDGFENLANYENYVPKEIKDWELLIFLNKSEEGEWLPVNISDNPEDSDFELVLSILWIKDGEYYSGIEPPDYYGSVVFGNWAASKEFKVYIYKYVRLQKEIENIKAFKSCSKKINALIALYDSTLIRKYVYQTMKAANCDKKWKNFIEELLHNGIYDQGQQRAIADYVVVAKPKKVNKIFETEIQYWRKYIAENKTAKWWEYKEPNGKRFFYFKALVYAIAQNKTEGWNAKCQEVFALFSQHQEYNTSNKNEKFHESLKHHYLD